MTAERGCGTREGEVGPNTRCGQTNVTSPQLLNPTHDGFEGFYPRRQKLCRSLCRKRAQRRGLQSCGGTFQQEGFVPITVNIFDVWATDSISRVFVEIEKN